MPGILAATDRAWGLLAALDAGLLGIVSLSLSVSLSATLIAAGVGLPLGTMLAVYRCPGRNALVLLANALLGLPPVVVGVILYLLLSRSGPLGSLRMLFTPGAMILAQSLLALPVVTAITHRSMAVTWRRYGDDFLALGLKRHQVLHHLLAIGRNETLTAILAGFGRSVSEVGAVLIVGGNIAGHTRTMTTAITLETSEGHIATSLALGFVLIVTSLVVSAAAFLLSHTREQASR